MTERRYTEAEVAAIFEGAAEAQRKLQAQLPSAEGLTLTEIQEIGREVGFSPEQLAVAAKTVALAPFPTSRRFLGFPIGVGLSVDLGRKLSEREWEQLVADLRATFEATGGVKQEGSFRQWRNGNLQAVVEPAPAGDRFRIRSTKGDSLSLMVAGIGMLGLSVVAAVATFMNGGVTDPAFITAPSVLGGIGATLFAIGGLRLPGWARVRRKQMQEVASRVALGPGSPPR